MTRAWSPNSVGTLGSGAGMEGVRSGLLFRSALEYAFRRPGSKLRYSSSFRLLCSTEGRRKALCVADYEIKNAPLIRLLACSPCGVRIKVGRSEKALENGARANLSRVW